MPPSAEPTPPSRDLLQVLADAGLEPLPIAGALTPLEPWLFPKIDRVLARFRGPLDDARLELVEYEYVSLTKNVPRRYRLLLALVHHPQIAGGAWIRPEEPTPWIVLLLLAPVLLPVALIFGPFMLLGALFGKRDWKTVDRLLGHRDFDRRYFVHAESDEAAARAVTPALREHLVRARFGGTIALHPGLLACTLPGARLDAPGLPAALRQLQALVRAATPAPAHPLR